MPNEASESSVRNLLVEAAHILAGMGLVQGHGHLSQILRDIDGGPLVVSTPRAAPSLATAADMIAFRADELQTQQHCLPVEAVMHTEIYATRPDVGALVRVHSQVIDAIGARVSTLPIVHGRGSHLRGSPQVLDDPSPISSRPRAMAVASLLADRQAVILRGNGAVIIGHDLRDAVANASYLLETVTIHLAGGFSLPARAFTDEEIALRGGSLRHDSSRRTWDYLRATAR